MKAEGILVAIGVAAVALTAWAQDAPKPDQFAWRARIALVAPTVAAQLTLPADAMRWFTTPARHDLRVFNADAEPVAIALLAPAASTGSAQKQTRTFPALALFESSAGQAPAKGSIQVSMDANSGKGSVWVQLGEPIRGDKAVADSRPLPAALLDTRLETQTISSLTLDAEFPANTLINVALAKSNDLVHWTPIPVNGPLFHFDGNDSPRNQTLELRQPLQLQGHYLRLRWDAGDRIRLAAATATVARADATPDRVSLPLAAEVAEGSTSHTWQVDFVVPLAALQLRTDRANTLVPVRVLGRNDTTQAWRPMGQGVIYRIGTQGQEATNPAIALNGASARWLRVEATNGMTLAGISLKASAEFTPLRLVFLTSGNAPFELAVGRTDTPTATIHASLLRPVVNSPLEDLPQAILEPARVQDLTSWHTPLTRFLSASSEKRTMVLWLVLVAGVLVLGATAFSLMRQLPNKARKPAERG